MGDSTSESGAKAVAWVERQYPIIRRLQRFPWERTGVLFWLASLVVHAWDVAAFRHGRKDYLASSASGLPRVLRELGYWGWWLGLACWVLCTVVGLLQEATQPTPGRRYRFSRPSALGSVAAAGAFAHLAHVAMQNQLWITTRYDLLRSHLPYGWTACAYLAFVTVVLLWVYRRLHFSLQAHIAHHTTHTTHATVALIALALGCASVWMLFFVGLMHLSTGNWPL